MTAVRGCLRGLGALLVTLAVVLPLVVLAAARCLPGRRAPAAALRGVLVVQRLWCRALLIVLGVHVTVRGELPAGTVLFVSNHLSYLDIAVLGSLRPCRFVAKSEVREWPGFGLLARMAAVIFVRRQVRRELPAAAAQLADSFTAGAAAVLFPEGTSTRGEGVLPFHASLLAPAAEAAVPCQPVALRYATPHDHLPVAQTVCWWGEMEFLPHLRGLLRLRRIEATVLFPGAPLVGRDRRELARRLHAAVAAAFTEGELPTAGTVSRSADPVPFARELSCP